MFAYRKDQYFDINMYRKYSLRRTQVLNTHNYLLEATQIETNKPALFHQVLVSANSLPSLFDAPTIEKAIEQSENQNCVNEVSGRFEFYLEQNLLQIRLREELKPITEIAQLPIRQVLKLLGGLNLDLVITTKQMRSMVRHNQEGSSNSLKFFSKLILKAQSSELVIPFIDGQQIHFYDVYYQQAFGVNREKEKNIDDRTLKRKISEKKLKRKSQASIDDPINSDEIVFGKYMQLIVLLLSSPDIIVLLEGLTKLGPSSQQEIIKKAEKMSNSATDRTEKMFMELLHKCLANSNEYNLNIFIKECDILVDKHDKMQKSMPIDAVRDQNGREKHEEKLKNSKSCLSLNKSDKIQQSFSSHQDRPFTRQSEKRLKGSKSLINLKAINNSLSLSNNRNLKTSKGLFSKSKQKLQDKSNIFQQSWAACSKGKNTGFGANPSSSLNSMASSATSNWFTQSMSENESVLKLRNFKKTNNFANTTGILQHHSQISNLTSVVEAPGQQIDRVDESQVSRFSKLIRRESTTKNQKMNEKSKEVNDQHTMTEQIEEELKNEVKKEESFSQVIKEKEAKSTPKKKNSFKRQIVNTINLNFFQEVKRAPQEKRSQTPKKKMAASQLKAEEKKVEIVDKIEAPPQLRQSVEKTQAKPLVQTASIFQKDNKLKQSLIAFKSPVDQQQFQQITFTKKENSKISQNSSFLKKSTLIKETKTAQSKPLITSSQLKQSQTKSAKQKLTILSLPQTQKMFYIKHFELFLKFFKQNNNILNKFPQYMNLSYVINCLYYKTLLECKMSDDFESYKRLIDLLCKKQQKIGQKDKENCLLFRVSFESIWTKTKPIRLIESEMSKGIEESALRQKIAQAKSQFLQYYTLTTESNQLLQRIYKELTNYVLTNKFPLIKNNAFVISLQLIYLVTLSMIISIQRENYYQSILEGKYEAIKDCFSFKYEKSEEEYLANYKKKIEGQDLTYLSVQQECNFFQSQYNKYK